MGGYTLSEYEDNEEDCGIHTMVGRISNMARNPLGDTPHVPVLPGGLERTSVSVPARSTRSGRAFSAGLDPPDGVPVPQSSNPPVPQPTRSAPAARTKSAVAGRPPITRPSLDFGASAAAPIQLSDRGRSGAGSPSSSSLSPREEASRQVRAVIEGGAAEATRRRSARSTKGQSKRRLDEEEDTVFVAPAISRKRQATRAAVAAAAPAKLPSGVSVPSAASGPPIARTGAAVGDDDDLPFGPSAPKKTYSARKSSKVHTDTRRETPGVGIGTRREIDAKGPRLGVASATDHRPRPPPARVSLPARTRAAVAPLAEAPTIPAMDPAHPDHAAFMAAVGAYAVSSPAPRKTLTDVHWEDDDGEEEVDG